MAEAAVSIVLETLRDLLLEEGRFLSGVSGEVKALQEQLEEMKCLLKDADKRQHESETVRNWIAKIRDLAYRAEDAIETYVFYVSSKRRQGFKNLVRRSSCLLKEGYSLHQIGSEISEIRSEVARVTKSMQEYGIRSIIEGESSTSDNQRWKRQTFPQEIDDCYVGKDEELEQLVSLMVDDKEHRVVSVWGMGGIGKTTIARKVYNHNKTKRFFESFAWVCITQQCRIRSVLEDVLNQLNPQIRDDIPSLSDGELIGQLCEIQKAKRCMIVLDDLWETDHWDGLKNAFLIAGLKSKILLTTRKQNVANIGHAFEVGLLNVEDGWELLKKKAFPHNTIPDSAFDEKLLQEIGKEMVRKCGRLPLAISLLGGVLSEKKSTREWQIVNENISAYLYKDHNIEKKEIDGVLRLSYEDLPYYLKPCFLYMGLFKEDEDIDNLSLYMMWIAQGMISHDNQGENMILIDIAELYLSELASRCIVQVQVLQDAPHGRKYGTCKLHDVVRELCLSKGKQDLGLQILNCQGGKFSTPLHELLSGAKTRHLAIHFEGEMELKGEEFKIFHEDARHIRSLLFLNNGMNIEFPHNVVDHILQRFKLLRVLVFQNIDFKRRKLPRGIGDVIHLRYLSFRSCELDMLPSSISNLAYLSTLDLGETKNVQVPNVLKKLYRLKHLFLSSYDKERIGNYRLRLEGVDELESLIGFDSSVHEWKYIIRMKNLRIFAAKVRDNESLSAILSPFNTNWKNLQIGGLEIFEGCQFTSVDEGLMNLKKVFTCPNLHWLAINVQLGKLLKECGNQIITSKLVRLILCECEIEDDPMEILGKLPFLETLVLEERSFVGEKMKCHALDFPHLKSVDIVDLPNLKEWTVEQGAMPIISDIGIRNCPHLVMVPDGLRFIGNLQKLRIIGMLDLAKRVSNEEGEDYDKVRHVPSIIID